MISILLVILLGVLALYLGKYIRTYFNVLVVATLALSIASMFVSNEVLDLFSDGFVGLAFFIIVMYAGAFKKGSTLNKKLRAVRKEYSILGFVTLLPHALLFLYEYVFNGLNVEWFGIIAFVVMIPLFVTSFTYVKKQMDIKKWFQLQRYAYVAYLTIYLHLMFIGQDEHKMIYTVVFVVYTGLKVFNYVATSKALKITTVIATLVALAIGIVTLAGNIDLESTEDTSLIDEVNDTLATELSDFADGTYTGYSTGFQNLDVEVVVTVENGLITDINIIEYGGTSAHKGTNFEDAASEVAEDIVDEQSVNVDTISGATYTTTGIINAVKDALNI